MRALAIATLFAGAALLGACASPRYQTVSRYEAPADPAARPCIERCEAASGACKTRCQGQHEACLKTIDAEAEAKYAEALKRYAHALDSYRLDLERYRMDMWLSWGHGHFWWHDPWPFYPMPTVMAGPPSREAVRDQIAKERCDQDCGCRTGYEGCLVGCGGRKVEETRCIANCPPK